MNESVITDTRGFVYEPIGGEKRKVEFEPQSDGQFIRTEALWTGCRWRVTGEEIVATVWEV